MIVLVDSSVWIDHFRRQETVLSRLLEENAVLIHSFVIGELACGNFRNRSVVLRSLEALPRSAHATHDESLRLVDERKLWGAGLGWIDMHLLASALLSGCLLWTLDQRLDKVAAEAGVRRFEGSK